MIRSFLGPLAFGLALAMLPIAALPGMAQTEPRQNLLEIYQQAVTSDPTLAAARSANKATQERLAQARALFFQLHHECHAF